jgi:pimeloyl-ACP methyl ester carboxylesterase
MLLWFIALTSLSASALHAQDRTDSSPHTAQFVTVSKGVKLEVLDWGGGGRPLIFLAGMGNTAHVFDNFAPKFAAKYHVYGITRRGFGASSQPAPTVDNYSARRLGDDVLAVMDALKINRPVLVGHSVAGEELSSVGSRYPEKVAGLIYLDAGYGYAYYDRVHGDVWLDLMDVRKRIDQLQAGTARDPKPLWQGMLTDVSHLDKALREITKEMASMPSPRNPPPIPTAIQFGAEKYTEIHVSILAFFALPRVFDAHTSEQADAFEAGLPSAHVVRLQNADHFVFNSNEAEVFREMNAFLAQLH